MTGVGQNSDTAVTDSTVTSRSPEAVTTESNTNAATPTQAPSQSSLLEQLQGMLPNNLGWLIWLLPLLLILALLWVIWKLLRGGKPKRTKRVQQPAATESFVDYSQSIDPDVEIEQEPPLEVSIKMDVARAYIEAGDMPAARDMLTEVIREGTLAQQEEANELLMQL